MNKKYLLGIGILLIIAISGFIARFHQEAMPTTAGSWRSSIFRPRRFGIIPKRNSPTPRRANEAAMLMISSASTLRYEAHASPARVTISRPALYLSLFTRGAAFARDLPTTTL